METKTPFLLIALLATGRLLLIGGPTREGSRPSERSHLFFAFSYRVAPEEAAHPMPDLGHIHTLSHSVKRATRSSLCHCVQFNITTGLTHACTIDLPVGILGIL